MENLDPPPPPPQIKDEKMARFCPSRAFIFDLGGMGICCSILIILDKINGKPRPNADGKMARFCPSRAFILDLGGGGDGGLLFNFILTKIVGTKVSRVII